MQAKAFWPTDWLPLSSPWPRPVPDMRCGLSRGFRDGTGKLSAHLACPLRWVPMALGSLGWSSMKHGHGQGGPIPRQQGHRGLRLPSPALSSFAKSGSQTWASWGPGQLLGLGAHWASPERRGLETVT